MGRRNIQALLQLLVGLRLAFPLLFHFSSRPPSPFIYRFLFLTILSLVHLISLGNLISLVHLISLPNFLSLFHCLWVFPFHLGLSFPFPFPFPLYFLYPFQLNCLSFILIFYQPPFSHFLWFSLSLHFASIVSAHPLSFSHLYLAFSLQPYSMHHPLHMQAKSVWPDPKQAAQNNSDP